MMNTQSEAKSVTEASRSPRSYASKPRRTISTFSCDIARAVSRGPGGRVALTVPVAEKSDRFEDVLQFIALYGQYFFLALLAWLFLARGKWG